LSSAAPNLEILRLSLATIDLQHGTNYSPEDTANPSGFALLQKLKTLDLSDSVIRNLGPLPPTLTTLHISHVGNTNFFNLSNLPKLIELSLNRRGRSRRRPFLPIDLLMLLGHKYGNDMAAEAVISGGCAYTSLRSLVVAFNRPFGTRNANAAHSSIHLANALEMRGRDLKFLHLADDGGWVNDTVANVVARTCIALNELVLVKAVVTEGAVRSIVRKLGGILKKITLERWRQFENSERARQLIMFGQEFNVDIDVPNRRLRDS
jgi:hypothetical protein